MSTNLISGLSSGFDWRSMIDQLMKIENRRVDLLGNRKTEHEQKLTEWQSFNTKLLALKTAAGDLARPESFDLYRPNLSSGGSAVEPGHLVSVTATSLAARGTFTITVDALATAERLRSGSFDSAIEALGLSGDIEINGVPITLTESDTLASVRTKINDAGAGVTASIVSYGENDHRLTLTSNVTGAEGINFGGSSSILGELSFEQIAAGSDATFVIDGIAVSRSSNVIEGVIEGVTINLLKADSETTVTISMDRDVDAVMDKIKGFVDAYNAVAAYMQQQQSFDPANAAKRAALFGDGTLSSIRSDLTSLLTQPVAGAAPDLFTLGLAGIEVDRQGQLTMDEEKVRGHLEARFDDAKILFSGNEPPDEESEIVGIAKLFERALFNITDPYSGYVSFKQDSLRNSIKDLDIRVEQMEGRLNRKMEMMINRFVAMETALGNLQSQSQWLSGQNSASWNAWGR